MKIGAVSGDMVIKLAMGAAVLGLGYMAFKKLSGTAGAVFDGVAEVADTVVTAVNPASSENLINRGVSAVGGAIVKDPAGPGKNADGSWSLGGWIYDVTH